MALQSQAPRAGTSRRYTASTRRKKGLAPWLALIGVAVILAGLYVLFFNNDDPAANANAAGQTPRDGNTPAQPASAGGPRNTDNPGQTTELRRDTGPTPPIDRDTTVPPRTGAEPDFTGPAAIAAANDPDRKLVGEAKDQYELGMQRLEAGDYVAGRALLSELLFREGALPRHEARAVRERLTHLSSQCVFGRSKQYPPIINGVEQDPIRTLHKVQQGEYLGPIANTYRVPYQLLERINNTEARKLQAGQSLQVIKGPVHARIDKSDYRMDLFVVDPDGLPIYLKSYTVGLGEFDSTPIGKWRIKPGSKVGPANGGPSWRNPRTGKVYDRNDPDIPIGEYWMALEGIDEKTKGISGYGIHATNDPESIGRQESMGCIRMRDKDVDEVFYTLFEGASTVEIVP